MNTQEHKFWSIGCSQCGGLQLGGRDKESLDIIPIFTTRTLAELALSDWQSEDERDRHPPIIVEIGVRILPQMLPNVP